MKPAPIFWQTIFDQVVATSTLEQLEKLEREFRSGVVIRWEIQKAEPEDDGLLKIESRVTVDQSTKLVFAEKSDKEKAAGV